MEGPVAESEQLTTKRQKTFGLLHQKNVKRHANQQAQKTPNVQTRKSANAFLQAYRRSLETPEQTRARRAANAIAQARRRAQETPEQTEARKVLNALSNARRRSQQTPEQTKSRRVANALLQARRRSKETWEERELRRASNAFSQARRRSQQKSERTEERRATNIPSLRSRRVEKTKNEARKIKQQVIQTNTKIGENIVNDYTCSSLAVLYQFSLSHNFAVEHLSDGKYTSCHKEKPLSDCVYVRNAPCYMNCGTTNKMRDKIISKLNNSDRNGDITGQIEYIKTEPIEEVVIKEECIDEYPEYSEAYDHLQLEIKREINDDEKIPNLDQSS